MLCQKPTKWRAAGVGVLLNLKKEDKCLRIARAGLKLSSVLWYHARAHCEGKKV